MISMVNALSKRRSPHTPNASDPQSIPAKQETLVAGMLVLFAILFNLYHLRAELVLQTPPLNDDVLHLLTTEQLAEAVGSGQSPIDFWLAPVSMGYPLVRHYQHLPYLIPVALYRLFQGVMPLDELFYGLRYLLLSCFPLTIYWSMRRFGFERLDAALAALVAGLLSTNGLYGFDFGSYVWSGYGLTTQLWGMFLLPPALSQGYVALKTGRGYAIAAALLALTAVSHLVIGYIAVLSVICCAFPPVQTVRSSQEFWTQCKRLLRILLPTAVLTAYFWLPFLLDAQYMNRSVWEDSFKINAYGHAWTLTALWRGDLFDFGRFPSLTLLVAAGIGVCVYRWRDARYRVPAVLFCVWLLLFFGRPTWGPLIDLLPLSDALHLHRLIAGVHLAGIYLMGLGLALPWRWALLRGELRIWTAVAALTVLLLAPVFRERGAFLAKNARLMDDTRHALAIEEAEISALLDTLGRLPPGRVYAGLGQNWGKAYTVGSIPVYALLNRAGVDMVGYLYHALSLNADLQVLFDETRPEQYRVFNVRYVVAPAELTFPNFVQPVAAFGRHRLYQVETGGYFDLVDADLTLEGATTDFQPAAFAWLGSALPANRQHPVLVLDNKMETGLPTAATLPLTAGTLQHAASQQRSSCGKVIAETIANNRYAATVDVTYACALLFKATYAPGWIVSVDGAETPAMMLMPSFVGLRIEPGTHLVQVTYRPRPDKPLLLAFGLVAFALFAGVERSRSKAD